MFKTRLPFLFFPISYCWFLLFALQSYKKELKNIEWIVKKSVSFLWAWCFDVVKLQKILYKNRDKKVRCRHRGEGRLPTPHVALVNTARFSGNCPTLNCLTLYVEFRGILCVAYHWNTHVLYFLCFASPNVLLQVIGIHWKLVLSAFLVFRAEKCHRGKKKALESVIMGEKFTKWREQTRHLWRIGQIAG